MSTNDQFTTETSLSWADRGGWKPPVATKGKSETSIAFFGAHFPIRPLFSFETLGMGAPQAVFEGVQGRRTVSRCLGGSLTGDRLKGSVAEDLSNEWRTYKAAGGAGFTVEGLVTLLADTGETILMKYIGRGGERYGAGSYRIGAVFEAPASTLGWLNSVCAAGKVEVDGDTLRFDLYELMGAPGAGVNQLQVEPLYRMTGQDTVGNRLTIQGAVSNRYFTLAESGCRVEGAFDGTWLKGMSWGPHRMAFSATSMPWQIDMKVMLKTSNGTPVLQQYLGTIPDRVALNQIDDPSWRTVAVFETEASGPLSWLNDVVALGVGWKENNEAHYYYYSMT